MSQDREATHGSDQTAMGRQQSPSLPVAFLNHLVVQANPHRRPPPNTTLRNAQIACSRWLLLCRLRMRLSLKQLAAMTSLPIETITLIESGLADPSTLSVEARQRIVTSLAPRLEDQSLASDALALALGQVEALSVTILDRVIDDLSILDGEEERNTILAKEMAIEPDPISLRAIRRIDPALLQAEPAMFDALRVLSESTQHDAELWQAIQDIPDRSRDPSTTFRNHFSRMLTRMIEEGLIVKADVVALPGVPGRKTQRYQITNEGRHAFRVEWLRRAFETAQTLQKRNQQEGEGYFGAPNIDPLPNT